MNVRQEPPKVAYSGDVIRNDTLRIPDRTRDFTNNTASPLFDEPISALYEPTWRHTLLLK
jgi:hypothetical protein